MKYIIMADGRGTRWHNYNNIPKHLIKIDGETLLERLVRQILAVDKKADIIITSHNPQYEVKGARRYEPINNVLEIDRFTNELIEDDICFLYGDTYYTDLSVKTIFENKNDDLLFFGNTNSLVAVKVYDAKVFKKHLKKVRQLFLAGEIDKCAGWQVYQSFQGLDFNRLVIKDKFILVDNETLDFDTPEDYETKILNKVDDKNGEEVFQ